MKKQPAKPKMGRPATGQTPKRIFRMADDDWTQVEQAAQSLGETTSEFVRRVLLKSARSILKTGS